MQERPGHTDARTTMIYPHVLNRGGRGVVSPADLPVPRPVRAPGGAAGDVAATSAGAR